MNKERRKQKSENSPEYHENVSIHPPCNLYISPTELKKEKQNELKKEKRNSIKVMKREKQNWTGDNSNGGGATRRPIKNP